MNLVFFDDDAMALYPFTLTRPASEIRIGIMTIREKWEYYLKCSSSWLSEPHLNIRFALAGNDKSLYINGKLLPDESLVEAIKKLKPEKRLVQNQRLLAYYPAWQNGLNPQALEATEYRGDVKMVDNLWDIFLLNEQEIISDFKKVTAGRKSAGKGKWAGNESLFIEESAVVNDCFINTTGGPVYIGREAEVMEGVMIRGPLALCDHAGLKMGAKIYGATTIGPSCKVGGEVNNSVMFGFSNKAHDGFLGNSVIGEWCNLGADTNNSNLKNNYGTVKVWSYKHRKMVSTGRQFCGLFMGDYSKSGINTMFNTGTVAGVSVNLYGSDFPPKYIPSFSWGGAAGFERFDFDKACQAAQAMKARRSLSLTDTEKAVLKSIFESGI